MNVYYSADGSYRDMIYDKVCVRRCFRNKDGVASFVLAKKMDSWRITLPVVVLVSMVLIDPDDEYEYAHAKWMFAPNPAFVLPRFMAFCFFFFLAVLYNVAEARWLWLSFFLVEIAVNLAFTTLMMKEFRKYVKEGFYSPSVGRIARCGFWRSVSIWLLTSFYQTGRACEIMSKTESSNDGMGR